MRITAPSSVRNWTRTSGRQNPSWLIRTLVVVEAVAVNPVDAFIRTGRYRTPIPFPFVVGRDLVGTVFHAPARTGFAAGDRVWCNSLGHDGRQGSFARFAVVPADRLYRLPDGVDPLIAVAVAHPAGTAYLAWFRHGGLRPGDTVYVGGGAGNVGRAAIAMARYAGARVIAGARPADHAACTAAGATWSSTTPTRTSPSGYGWRHRTAWTCTGTPPGAATWNTRCSRSRSAAGSC
jgi:NADPH:quinone reductase-like Zn-dependent oxidoreductase